MGELPKRGRVDLRRLVPSGASLLAGFALLAIAVASYGIARESPLFAIQQIEVTGAPLAVRARVRVALAPLEGRSLVGFRSQDLDRRIAMLPDVVGASYDRAFPHTLRVVVRPETALLVLRRGDDSWLVSTRARVVLPLEKGTRAGLPRFWVTRSTDVAVGDTLADPGAQRAVRVLVAVAAELPGVVRAVRVEARETTLILRSGLELRLGREHDVRLKLAVAARILPQLDTDSPYLDVAVPDRPVAGSEAQSQVQVESSTP
ncbi:MAG TPA: FtsQ-type POTRA domain-containing protein [Gaiellaceae bacterium]|nr:FtsQ-type POTRA domain-containing protein [Gaiellaceae bacterium]